MIDHVTANVSDLEEAKGFYERALAPLGYSVQMEFEGAVGFVSGEGVPDFWLGTREERGAYQAAVAAGGKENGAPGVRPHYDETYYAAFVHDADGNNIEAVCHRPE
jgi:hypothetical protein